MGSEQSTQKKEKTKRSKRNEKLIYIGPNLIQLTKYTVLAGRTPKHINSLIKECPAVEKMLVPIEELAKSDQRAKQKGTLEHKYYQEVLSFLSEQRKGDI